MERFEIWLNRYADAWTHRDPDAVLELFAPGALYHESPFAEPIEGNEAIRDYWARGMRHSGRDVEFEAQALAMSDDSGLAHWRGQFTALPSEDTVQLDGILMATLDAEGRCTEFREWWHRLEDHG